jgi:hypothetical protein
MQYWLKTVAPPRPKTILRTSKRWATEPHMVWQTDAKEQQRLVDGTFFCYLTIMDEKSGALLAAPVFSL